MAESEPDCACRALHCALEKGEPSAGRPQPQIMLRICFQNQGKGRGRERQAGFAHRQKIQKNIGAFCQLNFTLTGQRGIIVLWLKFTDNEFTDKNGPKTETKDEAEGMFGVKKKEDEFFRLLIEFSEKIKRAGEAFGELVNHYDNIADKVANVKLLETECDMQVHKILTALNASFVTPFDREDIYAITKKMDDIVDCLEELSNSFIVFDIKQMNSAAVTMTDYIMKSIEELAVLFVRLPELKKNGKVISEQIIEVNRIENEGDLLYRKVLTELFREQKDPVELIKWKHLYEQWEMCLDVCEDVANMVEGVIMKHA